MSGTESNRKHAGALREKLIEEQTRNRKASQEALDSLRDSVEWDNEATNPGIINVNVHGAASRRRPSLRESLRPGNWSNPTKLKVLIGVIVGGIVSVITALQQAGVFK